MRQIDDNMLKTIANGTIVSIRTKQHQAMQSLQRSNEKKEPEPMTLTSPSLQECALPTSDDTTTIALPPVISIQQ